MIRIVVRINGDNLVFWDALIRCVLGKYDAINMILVGPRSVRFDLLGRTFLMASDEVFFNNLRDNDHCIAEWHTTFG